MTAHPGRAPTVAAAVQVGLLALLDPGTAGWVAGIGHAVISAVLLTTALRRSRSSCGPADVVTLARSTLTGVVAALVADGLTGSTPTSVLVPLAASALALDAVDGLVARRTGTASPLGARFDMEVDASLILVLSIHVSTALGPWVLAIGAMRYVFLAASRVAPWLNAPLPPSRARKIVAAAQGIALLVAASELLPPSPTAAVVALALAALLWSFGRDVRWLRRTSSATASDHHAAGTTARAQRQATATRAATGGPRSRSDPCTAPRSPHNG